MSERLFRLMERHQKIDAQIRHEYLRRHPDSLALLRLKKLKLAIKDRIARATRQRAPAL